MKGKSLTINQDNIQSLVHKMIKQLRDAPSFIEMYQCQDCESKQATITSLGVLCFDCLEKRCRLQIRLK